MTLHDASTPGPATRRPRPLYYSLFIGILSLISVPVVAQFGPPKVVSEPDFWNWSRTIQGDLNGDGHMDMVVFQEHAFLNETPMVLRYVPADGTYEIQRLNTSATSKCFDIVDIDGDGHMDLTFLMEGQILCAKGTPEGSLGPYEPVPSLAATGIVNVAFHDMNNDGFPDALVCINTGGSQVELRIRLNDGAGNFLAPSDASLFDTMSYFYMEVVDINGDGLDDVILKLSPPVGTIKVYVNDGGNGLLFTQTLSNFTPEPRIMDLDSDGLPDLVNRLGWSKNLGNGTFSEPMGAPVDMTGLVAGDGFNMVDYNGDGHMDLIYTTTGKLFGKAGNGDGTFATSPDLLATYPLFYTGGNAEVELMAFEEGGEAYLFVANVGYRIISRFRLTGGGAFEFSGLVTNPTLSSNDRLMWADLSGNGQDELVLGIGGLGLVASITNDHGVFSRMKALFADEGYHTTLDTADLDQDGDMDFITSGPSGGGIVHWNDGSGGFTRTTFASPAQAGSHSYKLADMDGDGYPDIITTSGPWGSSIGIYKNNGNGTFTHINTGITFPNGFALQVRDLDQDGIKDLVLLGTYYKGLGNMSFAQPIPSVGGEWDEMMMIDLDKDGDLDAVYLKNAIGWNVSWAEWEGGAYNNLVQVAGASIGAAYPKLFDMDGDGDIDILVLKTNNEDHWYRNDGTGSFEGPLNLTNGTTVMGTGSANATIHDVDGDGDLDVIYTRLSNVPGIPALAWLENFLGDPFQVTGHVFADFDGDGIQGAGEVGLPTVPVATAPTSYYAFTGTDGAYTVFSGIGPVQVSAQVLSPYWSQSSSPSSYALDLSAQEPAVADINFGFMPLVDTSMIRTGSVTSPGFCGSNTSMWITLLNEGTREDRLAVEMKLDSLLTFNSSVPEATVLPNGSLSWDLGQLEYLGQRTLHLDVSLPTVAHLGELVKNVLHVTSFDTTGAITGQFQHADSTILVCAVDPNDKAVLPAGYGAYGAVPIDQSHLDYTVRFQNTGTAPAFQVMLRDQLSPDLDRAAIQVTGYSHQPDQISVEPGGELVVLFNNIMLPDSGSDLLGSQGFFSFRIKLEEDLPHLTLIQNCAEIYFDLNPAVITNSTTTTLVDCNMWQVQINESEPGQLTATPGEAYQWYLNGAALPDQTGAITATVSGQYTVAVTSIHGCVTLSAPFFVTGISERQGRERMFSMYPNPFDGSVRIRLDVPAASSYRLELFDAFGRMVRSNTWTGAQEYILLRNDLASGIYLVRLWDGPSIVGSSRLIAQ